MFAFLPPGSRRFLLRNVAIIVLVFSAGAALSPTTARGQDIYVTNEGASTVGEYTISGGTVNPSLVSGLDYPQGVAVSGSNLFVTNRYGDTVGEYTTSGKTVDAALISGLSSPVGIAVSGSDVFVTNPSIGTIGEYTTSGGTVNAVRIELSVWHCGVRIEAVCR